MDLGMTPKVKPLVEKVRAMVREEIMPLEEEYEAEIGKGATAGPTPSARRRSARA